METCESLVVKEENNPLEVDYSIVGVKELATPEIKKEVEKLQLETKGKDFMVLFLSHFLFSQKYVMFCQSSPNNASVNLSQGPLCGVCWLIPCKFPNMRVQKIWQNRFFVTQFGPLNF